ncbi:hypothetical protein [Thalassobacillus sp. C254]|uniref:hypothetical protein n=1 Tax=Thalassobacillus sp. C254 TaxID=1225341 RepID=UPI0006D07BC3|nr:hypothetical protein [Thalassobacillus sp. C254]
MERFRIERTKLGFDDFTSTHLSLGTTLYATKEEHNGNFNYTIIASTEGEDVLYFALLEG